MAQALSPQEASFFAPARAGSPVPAGRSAPMQAGAPDGSTAVPVQAGPPDPAGGPVPAAAPEEGKAGPGAASLAVRQDGAPHELPPQAADVAVARTGGPNGNGRSPGFRTGADSAGPPAEPEPPGTPEGPSGAPPAAAPPAAPGESRKAPHAPAAPAAEGAREGKPADPRAARDAGEVEAAKAAPDAPDRLSDLLPGLAPAAPAHPGPHPARAAEAGAAPPPPARADANVPVVPNVPLAAVPVEIGLRSLSGLSRFEIRLDPEDLGRVDVRLDIDGDKVQARLTVDRVETLALLQRDARTLERAFEQAGLKPAEGGIDLTLRDPQGDARQQRGDDRPGREPPERRAPPDPDGDAPRILRTLWRAPGRLDLRI
jgi:flagellar hook-length control protein FliK